MDTTQKSRVCVTGASGFIGSSLVKMLLENGHVVHATLRNLGDTSKVGLLKSLPNAENNLVVFQADLYKASDVDFDAAINGCDFVFHVATPMAHDSSPMSQYKDTAEAAIAGVRLIAESCIRVGTVKRLIYTASVMSTSRLMDDGVGLRSFIDESCWTPLNHPFKYDPLNFTLAYTRSKTLAEKAILRYNEIENCKLEVVSLACGVVGGDTLLPYLSSSLAAICSIITGNTDLYELLKPVEEITGSIPLVHVQDVCRAHLFCIEKSSMKGRFLCGVADPTLKAIALYFQENFPEYKIAKEFVERPEQGTPYDFQKLVKMGFQYNYDMPKTLDDTVACGKRLGVI